MEREREDKVKERWREREDKVKERVFGSEREIQSEK